MPHLMQAEGPLPSVLIFLPKQFPFPAPLGCPAHVLPPALWLAAFHMEVLAQLPCDLGQVLTHPKGSHRM